MNNAGPEVKRAWNPPEHNRAMESGTFPAKPLGLQAVDLQRNTPEQTGLSSIGFVRNRKRLSANEHFKTTPAPTCARQIVLSKP
jgi:hypothetical protein